jgi:diguanylate cyclase (GGDEF)-like protein
MLSSADSSMLLRVGRGLWPPTDPALVDAGREADLAIGRARVAIVVLLAVNPATALVRHPDQAAAALALVIEILFIALAITVLQLARRHSPIPWLGFATAALDVSFITFYQAAVFTLIPLTSGITFALYLLAIVATSLRSDGRIAIFAGVLASIGWIILSRVYGDGGVGRIEELIIIAAATMLARIAASRARGLRLSSIRDNLTGLLTRAHFEERLATELMRSSRHNRPLALAIIDVDQFKRVNDTMGHLAGDEVLREVGARLTRTVRRTDLCARFGGDEFALAFIDTSVADAAAKLEEIRRTVSASPIPFRIQAVVTITCSAGVAVAPLDGHDATTLILIADTRLLAAKQAGRNRLMVAG